MDSGKFVYYLHRSLELICHVIACLAIFSCLLFSQQPIREASISEFPKLPKAVREDLRIRDCTVPQPPGSTGMANVIRGRFRDSQRMDWAVLCDIRATNTSLLLVYWGGEPSGAAVVSKSRLPDDSCWTDITPVGAAFIMQHYRAYGGPKPPPIDHEGIDVGICEKASTVSYFYRNRWLTLTGSD
jgi:hypothetical protein